MTDLRTAAQQALEALGLWATGRDMDAVALNDLIFRLEGALAQRQPDPVDEYRKGFIAGQIDMRDREQAEPVQEPVACRYPDCVDNGPEGKCIRWLVGECDGPKIGGQP